MSLRTLGESGLVRYADLGGKEGFVAPRGHAVEASPRAEVELLDAVELAPAQATVQGRRRKMVLERVRQVDEGGLGRVVLQRSAVERGTPRGTYYDIPRSWLKLGEHLGRSAAELQLLRPGPRGI